MTSTLIDGTPFSPPCPARCADEREALRTGWNVGFNADMTHAALTGAIRLPDGSWIRGRSLRRPAPSRLRPDYGLYLGSGRLRQRHEAELSWPHDWIDWPDFRAPRRGDRGRAIELIRSLHERAAAGGRVEVACGGGIGRTGTVIACVAVLAGVPPREAVSWTRAHYHPRAVETPSQRAWVHRFPAT